MATPPPGVSASPCRWKPPPLLSSPVCFYTTHNTEQQLNNPHPDPASLPSASPLLLHSISNAAYHRLLATAVTHGLFGNLWRDYWWLWGCHPCLGYNRQPVSCSKESMLFIDFRDCLQGVIWDSKPSWYIGSVNMEQVLFCDCDTLLEAESVKECEKQHRHNVCRPIALTLTFYTSFSKTWTFLRSLVSHHNPLELQITVFAQWIFTSLFTSWLWILIFQRLHPMNT